MSGRVQRPPAGSEGIAYGADEISGIELRLVYLPLDTPTSDAKVLTGRQKPLTEVALLFATIRTTCGFQGLGFSYSKRAGGRGLFAHATEVAPELLGEDPNDIGRVWNKLLWAGASMGRSGMAIQAIAAFDVALWDLKAKRAQLPLAKLLGAHRDEVPCYNTSAGFLSTPLDELLRVARSLLDQGIGGLKIKIGSPDASGDLARVAAVREAIGDDVALMVDVNQQWDRRTARRMGRVLEPLDLVWIEEPLDAHDIHGHAVLTSLLDTPIASGEMLTSVTEHSSLIEAHAVDVLQPDAPRVGGISPFLRIAALADANGLVLAPHFAMELHVHLAAAYPGPCWVEHFDWLEPLFEERSTLRSGSIVVPGRAGLGLTLSGRAFDLTVETTALGDLGNLA